MRCSDGHRARRRPRAYEATPGHAKQLAIQGASGPSFETATNATSSRMTGRHAMIRHQIYTGSDFERRFGYARAVMNGDWIFVSGTTDYDYEKKTLPATVETQARKAPANTARTLAEAGASLANVVRVRYLRVRARSRAPHHPHSGRCLRRNPPRGHNGAVRDDREGNAGGDRGHGPAAGKNAGIRWSGAGIRGFRR